MAKGKKRAKQQAKVANAPKAEVDDVQNEGLGVCQRVYQNQSCVGIFSLPMGISGKECLALVKSGQKKCYCADGGCECRSCQDGRKKMKKAFCLIAKAAGTCDVMSECKQCPKFKPCWIK